MEDAKGYRLRAAGCGPHGAAVIFIIVACWIAATPSGRAAGLVSLQPGAVREAGTIRGRVTIERPLAPVVRRPSIGALGMPEARDVPDRYRSIVYLETAPQGAFDEPRPGHAVMDQHNETFVPHVLAITVGTTVDFPNSDRFYHNVFSLSKPARFDLGRYAAGHSKSVRFDHPGIVRVFCDIHSHMSAFIVVFSHPFFAVTDDNGRYHIDHVPPGTYNVIAWNEGTATDPETVTVPAGGAADLDFVVR